MTRSKIKVKVTGPWKLEILPFFDLLRHLQWELATDHWFLNYGTISKCDRSDFLKFIPVFVPRDFELGRNVSCEKSTVTPVRGYFYLKLTIAFLCNDSSCRNKIRPDNANPSLNPISSCKSECEKTKRVDDCNFKSCKLKTATYPQPFKLLQRNLASWRLSPVWNHCTWMFEYFKNTRWRMAVI